MIAADSTAIAMTANCGTRLRPTWRQRRWPGTAPSRENANSIREAEVKDAVTQKNCATTQMKSSASAQFWLIDSDQTQGTRKPMFSIAPPVLGTASVTATSRMKPKITDITTDRYIPTAAIREAWFVSSAMCAEASKPVIVYCAISRPVAKTYQSDRWSSGTSSRTATMKSTPAMCQ